MIISKIDNELTQLLKAQITFLNDAEKQATLTITLEGDDIGDYIEEKSLKRSIEDMCDLKLLPAEKIYLEKTGRVKKEFISYFSKNPYIVPKIIKNKGKIIEISATGNLVDLILVEFPLTCVIREHIIQRQAIRENILYDAYIMEAVRRLQNKLDIIREVENFNIYIGGCRDRVSYDWTAAVMVTLAGDIKERIVGVNHMMSAFVLDFPTEAFLDDPMWLEHWDKKDIALSADSSDILEWDGVRVSTSNLNPGTSFMKYMIDGSNIHDAAHFLQHNRDKNVIVELNNGFLSDLGYDWKELKITKKILKSVV